MGAVLLDLRDPRALPPPRPNGRIVVLDDADTLRKHADVYRRLVAEPMVTGLICVAVGEAGPDAMVAGVALTLPRELRPDGEHRTGVLWVGDPDGVEWAPRAAPRFADRPVSGLDDLIAAVQVDEIFDRVLVAAAEMPGAVAGPGIRLVHGPSDPAALAAAAASAARALCAPDDSASRGLAEEALRLDAEHDPAVPALTAPVATAAGETRRRLDRATALARTLGSPWSLFPAGRPTAGIGTELPAAGRAAEAHRRLLETLLNRMDGHLEDGRPAMADVIELGVAEPRPARGREITAGLRRIVDDRLDQGVTLTALGQELRFAEALSAPQGVGRHLERVRRITVPPVEIPRFRRWPLSLWTLPVVALTGLATVVLSGPGRDGPLLGALLALIWFVAGWLLLARRPPERGFAATLPAAALTYGLSGVAGVAGGVLARPYLPDDFPVLAAPMALFGGFALLAVVLAGIGWRSAARQWGAGLPIGGLRDVLTELDDITRQACLTEWQPMRRRRAVSAVAGAAAAGVEAIRATLAEQGDTLLAERRRRHGASEPAITAPATELYDVLRGDLVCLGRAALDRVWAGSETPTVASAADAVRHLRRLLDEYREHVERYGVLSPFLPGGDQGPRDALMTRAWITTPAARDTLRGRPADEMTQLGDSRQITYLSGHIEPTLIRFGPARLGLLLERDPTDVPLTQDPGIAWTASSEFVGAVRLLPLRPESIRYGWDGDPL
jgi:hypothetical protein